MDDKILDIIDMSVEGDGIAREGENVYFIDKAVEGEKVLATISTQKDNLFWGEAKEIIEPTYRRTNPACPYFDVCGGCKIMHLTKDTQSLFKMLSLKRTIKKVTNLDIDVKETVSSPKDFGYRNSIQLKVQQNNGDIQIGFYQARSHNLVAIDNCIVCNDNNKALIQILKEYIKNTGAKIESVFASFFDNNLSILVQTQDGECDSDLFNALQTHFNKVSLWSSKQYNDCTLLNYKNAKFIAGEKSLAITFDDIELEVTPLDFVQVNFELAQKLYQDVVNIIGENKVVLDLYSGLGVTSIKFAQNKNYVCSIEQIKSSVDSATELVKKYNLQDKIICHCGDCAIVLPTLEFSNEEQENLVVFMDPPRKGAGKVVMQQIKGLNAKKIIYMSCNPNSLAKDLRELLDLYDIYSMQCYDMFPQTNSIESLTVLTKKESNEDTTNEN